MQNFGGRVFMIGIKYTLNKTILKKAGNPAFFILINYNNAFLLLTLFDGYIQSLK